MKLSITLSLLLVAASGQAWAQQLNYTPVNPSFGGSPFNSSHLLGVASAQNEYKAPTTTLSPAQQFSNQLQSQIYASLANQITDRIFGKDASPNGTVTFGGQTVQWNQGNGGVNLTIKDDITGAITNIFVPKGVQVN